MFFFFQSSGWFSVLSSGGTYEQKPRDKNVALLTSVFFPPWLYFLACIACPCLFPISCHPKRGVSSQFPFIHVTVVFFWVSFDQLSSVSDLSGEGKGFMEGMDQVRTKFMYLLFFSSHVFSASSMMSFVFIFVNHV